MRQVTVPTLYFSDKQLGDATAETAAKGQGKRPTGARKKRRKVGRFGVYVDVNEGEEEEQEAEVLEPELFREPLSPAFPLHVMFNDEKISENLIR